MKMMCQLKCLIHDTEKLFKEKELYQPDRIFDKNELIH